MHGLFESAQTGPGEATLSAVKATPYCTWGFSPGGAATTGSVAPRAAVSLAARAGHDVATKQKEKAPTNASRRGMGAPKEALGRAGQEKVLGACFVLTMPADSRTSEQYTWRRSTRTLTA